MANLTCGQCNFVNEAQRVYCHNCGAKLDRSLLPKEEEVRRETPDRTRKRIRQMTNPGANPIVREVKALVSTLVWAAIAAAVILIGRQPEGVPKARPTELVSRFVNSDLQDAVASPTARALTFTEEEINQHFKTAIKAKESAIPGIRFEHAYVNLLPGVVRTYTHTTLWGYPLYSGIAHRLEIKDGHLLATNVGGSFGRLAVHPAIMQYTDWAFQKLWPALKREREQMDRMQQVRVEKGRITLVTRGAAQ